MKTAKKIKARLEYLRGELRAERISQGELCELTSLASHIEKGDVELLEAAGVPEFPEPQPDKATARPFNYVGQMVNTSNIFTNGSHALVLARSGRLICLHENGQISHEIPDTVLTRSQLEPKRSAFSDTIQGAEKFALTLAEFNAQWSERHAALVSKAIEKNINEHAALEAVAEAAKRVGLPSESDGAQGFKNLGTALANLAAVRNGKAVQS
jgi:hypothetical protein